MFAFVLTHNFTTLMQHLYSHAQLLKAHNISTCYKNNNQNVLCWGLIKRGKESTLDGNLERLRLKTVGTFSNRITI